MNVSVLGLVLSAASEADAADMVEVIHAAFGARPPLDPPSTAIEETPETVGATLHRGGGIFATVDGRPAGVILIAPVRDDLVTFQRVSVHPDLQRHGVASAMVSAAEDFAAELGFERVELFARNEFAELIAFWQHRGFAIEREEPHGVILARALPIAVTVPTGEAMQDLGEELSKVLAAGDLIIATGDLGAGKTTLTQGIGRGLGSDTPIISPTFVISRVHRSSAGRPDLVHVDAYRLSSNDEIDDLDLDATVPESITVVEWGEGLAESLASSWLEIDIRKQPGSMQTHHDGTQRTVLVRAVGDRWRQVDLTGLRKTQHG